MIDWESPLEWDYIYLLEWDREVLRYKEQPLRILCQVGDTTYRYTPDFWVKRKDRIDLVEVKSSKYVNTPQAEIQKIIGTEYCRKENLNFIFITEQEIREGHLLRNIKMLFRYSRVRVSLYHIHKAMDAFLNNGPVSIVSLCKLLEDKLGNKDDIIPILYHLIYKQYLSVNMEEPITFNSIIVGGDICFEDRDEPRAAF
ncbi:MAG: TnsA endonuclease N-terminal domain-containing protein [Bacillota bacterium]